MRQFKENADSYGHFSDRWVSCSQPQNGLHSVRYSRCSQPGPPARKVLLPVCWQSLPASCHVSSCDFLGRSGCIFHFLSSSSLGMCFQIFSALRQVPEDESIRCLISSMLCIRHSQKHMLRTDNLLTYDTQTHILQEDHRYLLRFLLLSFQ